MKQMSELLAKHPGATIILQVYGTVTWHASIIMPSEQKNENGYHSIGAKGIASEADKALRLASEELDKKLKPAEDDSWL